MKRIYMDHAAATPTDPGVISAINPFLSDLYANPGAIHTEGALVAKKVSEARASVATVLGVHSDEIIFTGSATESANLALLGVVRAWQKIYPERTPHVILGSIEHDAVREPVRMLQNEGVIVTKIPVDAEGLVVVKNITEAITEDTVVISVMYANNEIGTIQPLRDIAKVIRKWKKEFREVVRTENPTGIERYPLFHTDACQATNYLDMNIPRLGVDLLTLSGAKIYGPKGIGLLAVTRGVAIAPLIVGGGQEHGRRAGTENVPGIIGMAAALSLVEKIKDEESRRLAIVRDYCISQLQLIPQLVVNGSTTARLPNNVHFSLPDVDHEFLAIALDARGIAVATKSACNESEAEESHVLVALNETRGLSYPRSGIRLSFGRETTKAHVDQFMKALMSIREEMLFPVKDIN